MGEKTWEGIYPRKASILVYFRWEGRTYRPTLKLPPTPKNMQYAANLRRDILRSIELGTFSFAKFFPDSKHASETDAGPTIADAVDKFLASKERSLAATTLREYRNCLQSTLAERKPKTRVSECDFAMLDSILSDLSVAGKTHNNIVSCWRVYFAYAVRMGWLASNPTEGIERAVQAEPEPDPLDQDEAAIVLADMAKHYDPQVANYFEGAIWLGWRPSEGIALTWSRLDWRKRILRIGEARVRGLDKGTKTGRARDVELDDRAIDLFRRQKAHTFLEGGRIFHNPVTGRPWWDTADLVQRYWRPSLKRLGIRDRDARQTRHTCATMMLMAGCNPAWCAGQLGHSVEMFLRTYSRWINGADRGAERAKLAQFTQQIHKTR
jgi:integrase